MPEKSERDGIFDDYNPYNPSSEMGKAWDDGWNSMIPPECCSSCTDPDCPYMHQWTERK